MIKSVRLAAAIEARKLVTRLDRKDPSRYDGPTTLEAMAESVHLIKSTVPYVPEDAELRRMMLSSMSSLHY